MGILSAIGFAYPLMLIGVPLAAAALVYAYRRRGQGTRLVVASTLLLKTIERTIATPKKFVPPPRFFFELLLLILLLLGAAGLYLRERGAMYALVIDNSLSMRAAAPASASGEDSMTLAKKGAESFLSGLDAESQIALYAASPAPRQLGGGLLSPSAAQRELERITPVYAGDTLDTFLPRLLRNEQYEKVLAFTDGHVSLQGNAAAKAYTRLEIHANSSELQSAHNIALTHISAKKQAAGGDSLSVSVNAASYAQKQVRASIALEVLEHSAKGSRFVPFDRREISIEPGASARVSFAAVPAAYQQFKARLQQTGENSSARSLNALAEDDDAFLALGKSEGSIYVISRFSIRELGLEKAPLAQFEQIVPERFGEALPADERAHTLIFHRITPSELPRNNALFIAPSPETTLFKVERSVARAAVSRWRTSHPILTYLSLPEMQLKDLSVLAVPAWARELVVTTEGVAAFAGEKDGFRYVVLGFEVLPFEGKNAATLSILTLNILKWLSDLSADTGFLPALSAYAPASDERSIEYVDGPPPAQGDHAHKSKLVLSQPGIVRVRGAQGDRFVAVNFFSEQESNLRKGRTIAVNAAPPAPKDFEGKRSLGALLALLVVLLLLGDLVCMAVRRSA